MLTRIRGATQSPIAVIGCTLKGMPEDFSSPPRGSFDSPSSGQASTPPPQSPPYGYAARPPTYGYPAPPPPARRSGWFWVAILGGIFAVIVLIVCITFAAVAKSFSSDSETATGFSSQSIAVIDISGVIMDADK